METGQKIKYGFYALIGIFFVYSIFSDDSSSSEPEYEEVIIPTQGLATILKEVETDLFKIEDEQALPSKEESIIVAKYMDGMIDTFTLDEARLMAADGTGSSRNRGIARAATLGYFGFIMMGRSMSRPVSSGAYMDQKTYNRVNKTTGTTMKQTATRTTRVKPGGKSGFGGKSTRSYGG